MLKDYPGFHWSAFEIAESDDVVKTMEDASGEVLTIVLDRDQSMSQCPSADVKEGAVPTLDVGGASFGHARSLPHVMKDPRRRRRIVIRVFSTWKLCRWNEWNTSFSMKSGSDISIRLSPEGWRWRRR